MYDKLIHQRLHQMKLWRNPTSVVLQNDKKSRKAKRFEKENEQFNNRLDALLLNKIKRNEQSCIWNALWFKIKEVKKCDCIKQDI